MNTGPYAQLLARNCERAAAPPARILSFFKRYDTDGSGQLSYDEMRLMVTSIIIDVVHLFCFCSHSDWAMN